MLFLFGLVFLFSRAHAEPSSTTTVALPKFNSLFQVWAVDDLRAQTNPQLNFRLRRAELKLSGSVIPEMDYFLMVDAAKALRANGDNRMIQDLGIALRPSELFELMLGQFKTLTTAEGLASSSELLFPERSFTGRFFGDRREPGLLVRFKQPMWKLGAMASNGEGTNADAVRNTKDLSLRLDLTPDPAWQMGAFVLLGDFVFDRKGAWGVNLKYAHPTIVARTEFAAGRTNGVNSLGWTGEAGYSVTEQWQPAVRYEVFKPVTEQAQTSQQVSLGVNYYLLRNQAKLQSEISYLHNFTGNMGQAQTQAGYYGPMVTFALQAAI